MLAVWNTEEQYERTMSWVETGTGESQVVVVGVSVASWSQVM